MRIVVRRHAHRCDELRDLWARLFPGPVVHERSMRVHGRTRGVRWSLRRPTVRCHELRSVRQDVRDRTKLRDGDLLVCWRTHSVRQCLRGHANRCNELWSLWPVLCEWAVVCRRLMRVCGGPDALWLDLREHPDQPDELRRVRARVRERASLLCECVCVHCRAHLVRRVLRRHPEQREQLWSVRTDLLGWCRLFGRCLHHDLPARHAELRRFVRGHAN